MNATTATNIKVISQAEAKSLQLTNDIGTYGWLFKTGSGTYVRTQKQAESWLRKLMQGRHYRPNNIGYVWQAEYDSHDGNGFMAQKFWGANYRTILEA